MWSLRVLYCGHWHVPTMTRHCNHDYDPVKLGSPILVIERGIELCFHLNEIASLSKSRHEK
jgi:hypothetical protein